MNPEDASPGKRPRRGAHPPTGTGDLTVTRAVVARSRYFSQLLAHKVITASESDGALESGLTAMIWNQVMSYGADAMVTVALAGTVFFSASADAQRGNVLLYLATTVAPFAVVAPVIGPALDRLQHGRRAVLAVTAIGRGVLAVVMAVKFPNLVVLFPAALGSLVLSKAYSVVRAAATPRLVPAGMTLVETNGRLSMFGLGAAAIAGSVEGIAIKVTGSYPVGLLLIALTFAVTAGHAFRLPKIVDSPPVINPAPTGQHGSTAVTIATVGTVGTKSRASAARRAPLQRLRRWALRGFGPATLRALQGELVMRWLSGYLTMFVVFFIEATSHGWRAVLSLAFFALASSVGNVVGTGVGSRLKLRRPDRTVLACLLITAVACALGAAFFTLAVVIIAMALVTAANALAKLSLDATIQREVTPFLHSAAFAKSETFLQLAWVFGATLGLLIPSQQGRLGFLLTAAVTGGATLALVRQVRAERQRFQAASPQR